MTECWRRPQVPPLPPVRTFGSSSAPGHCPTSPSQHICPDVFCPLCWVWPSHPRPGCGTHMNFHAQEGDGKAWEGELGFPCTSRCAKGSWCMASLSSPFPRRRYLVLSILQGKGKQCAWGLLLGRDGTRFPGSSSNSAVRSSRQEAPGKFPFSGALWSSPTETLGLSHYPRFP